MIKRFSTFIIFVSILSVSLWGQTKTDSIHVVSAIWETSVSPEGIIHKRASFPSLYQGHQRFHQQGHLCTDEGRRTYYQLRSW